MIIIHSPRSRNRRSSGFEELADMLEVMYAIAEARGYSVAELEAIRKKKAAERGGFRDRVYLDGVENQT